MNTPDDRLRRLLTELSGALDAFLTKAAESGSNWHTIPGLSPFVDTGLIKETADYLRQHGHAPAADRLLDLDKRLTEDALFVLVSDLAKKEGGAHEGLLRRMLPGRSAPSIDAEEFEEVQADRRTVVVGVAAEMHKFTASLMESLLSTNPESACASGEQLCETVSPPRALGGDLVESIERVLAKSDNFVEGPHLSRCPEQLLENILTARVVYPRGGGLPVDELAREAKDDLKARGLAPPVDDDLAFEMLVGDGLRKLEADGRVEAVTGRDAERVDLGALIAGVKGEGGSILMRYDTVWRLRKRPNATHSPDFTSVDWFGTRYTFAKGNQAESVRVLWTAWEAGGHSLTQETICERIESTAQRFRLAHVFRDQKSGEYHPAWGTMIQQVHKGVFALVTPSTANNHHNITS